MHLNHSAYRGWKLCVCPDGQSPLCLGHGVRAERPHHVIMAEAPTEAEALDELHRQVDAIEDAGNTGDVAALSRVRSS
jgi:hypothetical protein